MIPSIPHISHKIKQSEAMSKQVEEFLAQGNDITEVPFGIGQENSAESYRSMQTKISAVNKAAKEAKA